jgi:hypothetical protein
VLEGSGEMKWLTALLATCGSLILAHAEGATPLALHVSEVHSTEGSAPPLSPATLPNSHDPPPLASETTGAYRYGGAAESRLLVWEVDRHAKVGPLRRHSPLGATDVEPGTVFTPGTPVAVAGMTTAEDELPIYRPMSSQLVANCFLAQCTLILLDPITDAPVLRLHGSRSSMGEMSGQVSFAPWFRAAGRVQISPGDVMVVHMQDVGTGESEAFDGRLTVGAIVRNTFRYFDTRELRGISLSTEAGPVFGIQKPHSKDILSIIVTAGPDVQLAHAVSLTGNLGLQYAY